MKDIKTKKKPVICTSDGLVFLHQSGYNSYIFSCKSCFLSGNMESKDKNLWFSCGRDNVFEPTTLIKKFHAIERKYGLPKSKIELFTANGNNNHVFAEIINPVYTKNYGTFDLAAVLLKEADGVDIYTRYGGEGLKTLLSNAPLAFKLIGRMEDNAFLNTTGTKSALSNGIFMNVLKEIQKTK